MRSSRKLDHIKYSLQIQDGPVASGFDDFKLIHHCLPGLCWTALDLTTQLVGIAAATPVMVNAITGGAHDVTAINGQLAEFAAATGCIMAAGSQFAAIEDRSVVGSYEVIRQHNPNGAIIANVGAYAQPEQARRAVDMLEAAAIQIHLNAAQEITMTEGDRDFTTYLYNIEQIVQTVDVPVIVKEVGCGIAREQARMLIQAGVSAIDVGGAGGTNFVAIESARRSAAIEHQLLEWGIPTAVSAVEVGQVLPAHVDLVVSGGVRTPLDIVKALALNAKVVAMAAPVLRRVQQQGVEAAVDWFEDLLESVKRYMLLVGVDNIAALAGIPVVITGESAQWLAARGIDIKHYANRTGGDGSV